MTRPVAARKTYDEALAAIYECGLGQYLDDGSCELVACPCNQGLCCGWVLRMIMPPPPDPPPSES